MAQINVDPNIDINDIFTVESFFDSYFQFENLSDSVNNISYRIANATTSEAHRIETSNIYENYENKIFSCDYSIPSFDTNIDFSYLNLNLKIRSGQCADVSLIQEYRFRAYNTNLNQYVFWSAGIKDFSQNITGYNPDHLQNITILFIN